MYAYVQIGIIFSHILFMRGLGNVYDEIGLIVEVLKQVALGCYVVLSDKCTYFILVRFSYKL